MEEGERIDSEMSNVRRSSEGAAKLSDRGGNLMSPTYNDGPVALRDDDGVVVQDSQPNEYA